MSNNIGSFGKLHSTFNVDSCEQLPSSSPCDTSRSINFDRIQLIIRTLIPLTLPFIDSEGSQIQLWKTEKYEMIGSIFSKSGNIKVLSSNRVRAPFNPQLSTHQIMEGLESISLRR